MNALTQRPTSMPQAHSLSHLCACVSALVAAALSSATFVAKSVMGYPWLATVNGNASFIGCGLQTNGTQAGNKSWMQAKRVQIPRRKCV